MDANGLTQMFANLNVEQQRQQQQHRNTNSNSLGAGSIDSNGSRVLTDRIANNLHSRLADLHLSPEAVRSIAAQLNHLSLENRTSHSSNSTTAAAPAATATGTASSAVAASSSAAAPLAPRNRAFYHHHHRRHHPGVGGGGGGGGAAAAAAGSSSAFMQQDTLNAPHPPSWSTTATIAAAAESHPPPHLPHHPPVSLRSNSRGRTFCDDGPSTAAPRPPSRESSPIRPVLQQHQPQQHQPPPHQQQQQQPPQQQQHQPHAAKRPLTPIRTLLGNLASSVSGGGGAGLRGGGSAHNRSQSPGGSGSGINPLHGSKSPFRLLNKNRGNNLAPTSSSSTINNNSNGASSMIQEEKKDGIAYRPSSSTTSFSCPSSPQKLHHHQPQQHFQPAPPPASRRSVPERCASPLFKNMNPLFQSASTTIHNNNSGHGYSGTNRPGLADKDDDDNKNNNSNNRPASVGRCSNLGGMVHNSNHSGPSPIRGRQRTTTSTTTNHNNATTTNRHHSSRPRTPCHDDGGGGSQPAPPPRAFSMSPMRDTNNCNNNNKETVQQPQHMQHHHRSSSSSSSIPMSPVRSAIANLNLRTSAGLASPSQQRQHEVPTGAEDQPPPSPARGRSVTRRGWPSSNNNSINSCFTAPPTMTTTTTTAVEEQQGVAAAAAAQGVMPVGGGTSALESALKSLFTPPPVRNTCQSADDHGNAHPPTDNGEEVPFKTGRSKIRRKDGTPPTLQQQQQQPQQQQHSFGVGGGDNTILPSFPTAASLDRSVPLASLLQPSFMAGAPQMPSFHGLGNTTTTTGILHHPTTSADVPQQQQQQQPATYFSVGAAASTGHRRIIHARRPGANLAPRPRTMMPSGAGSSGSMRGGDFQNFHGVGGVEPMEPPVPVVGLHQVNNSSNYNQHTNSDITSPRPPSPMEVDSVQDICFNMGQNGNRHSLRNHQNRRSATATTNSTNLHASAFVPQVTAPTAPTAGGVDNSSCSGVGRGCPMMPGLPIAPPPPVHAASATAAAPQVQEPPSRPDYVGIVAGFREEARTHYWNSDFRLSILAYTNAIQAFGAIPQGLVASDTLAILYSNRAAAFMMIGAHAAAQSDCETALPHVSPPGPLGENFSNESSDPLKTKLFTRLGRVRLKQGDHQGAIVAFEDAIILAGTATHFSRRVHESRDAEAHAAALDQMSTEASLGKADAERLEETVTKITKFMNTETVSQSRSDLASTLGLVNLALAYASGCASLYETKLTLLGKMKRWREVAGVCERLAAENTNLDGVFVGSPALEMMNPFPGAKARAAYLVPTFFGESSEEDALTADLKLITKAVGEAVLRLPASLTSFYLRALRLEERYPAADQALSALENFVNMGTSRISSQELQARFQWLPIERDKWRRTQKCRVVGDEQFRDANFAGAAAQYANCLGIDSENRPADGTTTTTPSVTTGGRLHAVLHCNRAACLMATRQYSDALVECSNALTIHSRYMKAMLRRARCYKGLSRLQEAQSEYRRWLVLVEEAKKSPQTAGAFVPPCLFDGPGDVTDVDISTVHSELKTLLETQRKAEAATREEAARRQERQRWQENFATARAPETAQQRQENFATARAPETAQQRQEQWRSQQNETRRWDSFRGRGPRASSTSNNDSGSGHVPRRGGSADDTSAHQQQPRHHHHRRAGSWGQQESNNAQQQQQQQQHGHSAGSVGSPPSDDYYAILRLQPDASEADIKKAYRGLARQYHPDRNLDDPTAHGRFLKIKAAYDTLVDDGLRRSYDRSRRSNRRYW